MVGYGEEFYGLLRQAGYEPDFVQELRTGSEDLCTNIISLFDVSNTEAQEPSTTTSAITTTTAAAAAQSTNDDDQQY